LLIAWPNVKGTIIVCLRELVLARKGDAGWSDVLIRVSLDPASIYTLHQDVGEPETIALFVASGDVLGLSSVELYDAFGLHWCVVYAPKIYKSFYRKHNSTREFILDINGIHARLTAAIPNARPPRFQVEELGARSLLVTYSSSRQLIDLAVGLARGLGAHYNEKLSVKKLSPSQFRIDS
jgi:Haem-NO-binding